MAYKFVIVSKCEKEITTDNLMQNERKNERESKSKSKGEKRERKWKNIYILIENGIKDESKNLR